MTTRPRTIGFYGLAGRESVHQMLQGTLRYCDEVGGFAVRDFRARETFDIKPSEPPPWRGRADGMLMFLPRPPGSTDRQVADWVLSGGVPTVGVGADVLDRRIPCFHIDFASIGKLAVDHLTQCRCASYLYYGCQSCTGSSRRAEAFRAALAERGLDLVEYETSTDYDGTFGDEATALGEQELAALLRKMPQPIGVMALNDKFARAACIVCDSLGLAIPEQVKVLGVGDMVVARTHIPALSSICAPGEEIGYRAMRSLHKLLDGGRGVARVTQVPAKELVARASTVGVLPANGNLAAAIEYISRHACADLSVAHVADAMGISRSSLEKYFQRVVGHSPGREIQRVRLEKAKELVSKTQLSISHIALTVGFKETAAFSKFFTKEAGLSPVAFRRQQG